MPLCDFKFVCMSSRFPSVSHIDFCYHPVRLSKNGVVMYVPCGKCNGCLLQKANSMSFRLGDEIENGKNSIWFTLTYDNHYVPKMESRFEDGQFHWVSAKNNWRFNGSFDVLRDRLDFYSPFIVSAPLKNYHDPKVVGYLSKSDIQLYLKLLRKRIYENFNLSRRALRYYIIGEYGPGKNSNQGKFRPHYHGIIIPDNKEIATYLLEFGLYASWKMCDERLFKDNTKFCDSGTRHYVTEYVTGTTYLPKLLQSAKEIKPFALMSKQGSALGSGYFDKKKVYEDIGRGVDTYHKRVSRIERNYIFQYSSKITNSLFPKCCGYNLLPFARLLRIYGYLYDIRQVGIEFASIFNEFCDFSSQDFVASQACLKACDLMGWTPYHYVEVLDSFYYRKAQRALRLQYEFQQAHINDPYLCIGYYFNWKDFIYDAKIVDYSSYLASMKVYDSRIWFLQSFGFDFDNPLYEEKVEMAIDNSLYQKEVDSIIENADKSKKVNAYVGLAPHIV